MNKKHIEEILKSLQEVGKYSNFTLEETELGTQLVMHEKEKELFDIPSNISIKTMTEIIERGYKFKNEQTHYKLIKKEQKHYCGFTKKI